MSEVTWVARARPLAVASRLAASEEATLKLLSITEIAIKLGYSELPSFTRAFRKWTGRTPLAYRERTTA